MLCTRGASLNAVNVDNDTPLTVATKYGTFVRKYFLQFTILYRKKRSSIIKLLTSLGASQNPEIADKCPDQNYHLNVGLNNFYC